MRLFQLLKSSHKNWNYLLLFSDHSLWILRTFGWLKMIVSRDPFTKNMNSICKKSIKKLLKFLKRLQTVLENYKNKLSNFILQEIISNLNRWFQILKTSSFFLILTQNMIYADIGKNLNKNLLIQLFNTIKLLKDFRCIIIRIQMIFLELSHKYQDSSNNLLISKPIILLNSDIQKF